MERDGVFGCCKNPKQILILPQYHPAQHWEEELIGIGLMLRRMLMGEMWVQFWFPGKVHVAREA